MKLESLINFHLMNYPFYILSDNYELSRNFVLSKIFFNARWVGSMFVVLDSGEIFVVGDYNNCLLFDWKDSTLEIVNNKLVIEGETYHQYSYIDDSGNHIIGIDERNTILPKDFCSKRLWRISYSYSNKNKDEMFKRAEFLRKRVKGFFNVVIDFNFCYFYFEADEDFANQIKEEYISIFGDYGFHGFHATPSISTKMYKEDKLTFIPFSTTLSSIFVEIIQKKSFPYRKDDKSKELSVDVEYIEGVRGLVNFVSTLKNVSKHEMKYFDRFYEVYGR